MTTYVLGFLFQRVGDLYTNVLLIQKAKPAWQKGQLNGIGGKVEPGETPYEAMIREMREESGLLINGWREFLVMKGTGYDKKSPWICHTFCTDFPENGRDVTELKSEPDEPVKWYDAARLPKNTLYNLRWIIPMAYDNVEKAEVRYE